MSEDRVRSVQFHADGGVVIEFGLPEDMKANGAVMNRAVAIPPDTVAIDELEALTSAAERALSEVLQRWHKLREADLSGDDAPGYDNPEEREYYR